jgi:hypothetical protein
MPLALHRCIKVKSHDPLFLSSIRSVCMVFEEDNKMYENKITLLGVEK